MANEEKPVFNEQTLRELEELMSRYPTKRAALLPALRLAEREWGSVSEDALRYVAELLDLSPAYAFGVFSFYTHFRRPGTGKYRVMACRTLPCSLGGAEAVRARIEKRLGLKFGQTSADGVWSLEFVECLGACDKAPAIQINDDMYESLTVEKIDAILDKLIADAGRPAAGGGLGKP
jgi:NADH-quinone oxidoreductase subunit E